jgi:hypothetical protein
MPGRRLVQSRSRARARSRVGILLGVAGVALALSSAGPARADVRVCIDQHSEGQLLRDQSQFLQARSRFVSCADPACPDAIRAECASLLNELERALPTVVLAARDTEQRDVPGVRVELDGQAVEDGLNGRAIAMNPGAHSLRFIAPDGRTKVIDVVALEWVKGRAVEVTFDTAVPAAPAPSAPPQQPGQNTGVPAVPHSGGRRTVAYVLGGVGIAALAGAGYFAWSGRSRKQELSESCAPVCTEDQVSPVRSQYLIADILLGVGVVSVGTGAYLYFTPSDPAGPTFAARGAMAGIRGAF